MRTQQELKRLALAAVLTALSIGIDVFFKQVLGLQNFGVPFYAVPIIFGSVLLGPIYGVAMALVGDAIGVILSGYGYLPLFALAAFFWGLIPGLLMRKQVGNQARLALSLFLTYVLAFLSNTFAIYFHFSLESAMSSFFVRLGLIPFNTILMFFIIRELDRKLRPVSDRFIHSKIQAND